jgi:GxxExxY protein
VERDERTYALIGAAMEVHRILGPGNLEAVYHEALEIELALRGIPFEHKPELIIDYKGHELDKRYYPDLRVLGEIVVQLRIVPHRRRTDHQQPQMQSPRCGSPDQLRRSFSEVEAICGVRWGGENLCNLGNLWLRKPIRESPRKSLSLRPPDFVRCRLGLDIRLNCRNSRRVDVGGWGGAKRKIRWYLQAYKNTIL